MVRYDSEDNVSNSDIPVDKKRHFAPQVSYDEFKELMKQVEDLVGAGSNYSMDSLMTYYGNVEMTYQEALAEYHKTIYDDRISRAFARLFCDFLSRSLGLYPVFVAVLFWMRDKRNRMNELIYPKTKASWKLIWTRYTALLTAVMLPVFLLSLESLVPLVQYSVKAGISIDHLAFLKYILWWLLPTAMVSTAVGTVLTVFTDTPVAIVVQGVWWLIDSGVTGLSGDVNWFTLMVRHNTLRGSELIQEDFLMLWANRGILVLLSVILLILTCVIYEKKRGGKWNYGHRFREFWRTVKGRLVSHIQK